jgi:prepilin-type N-terminal cleavage/methylation domain-containing protein
MHDTSHQRGFTLIELLVSVSLFTAVMMVSIGSLLALTDASRQAQTLKSISNNLNFALDSMTRNIRTGAEFECYGDGVNDGGDCEVTGGTEFRYMDDRDRHVRYRYNSTDKSIERSVGSRAAVGGYERMTAEDVSIEAVRFYVRGTQYQGVDGGDNTQPTVTIAIRATAGNALTGSDTAFNIQTTVVQRILDI